MNKKIITIFDIVDAKIKNILWKNSQKEKL
jgi:hypothetical protein